MYFHFQFTVLMIILMTAGLVYLLPLAGIFVYLLIQGKTAFAFRFSFAVLLATAAFFFSAFFVDLRLEELKFYIPEYFIDHAMPVSSPEKYYFEARKSLEENAALPYPDDPEFSSRCTEEGIFRAKNYPNTRHKALFSSRIWVFRSPERRPAAWGDETLLLKIRDDMVVESADFMLGKIVFPKEMFFGFAVIVLFALLLEYLGLTQIRYSGISDFDWKMYVACIVAIPVFLIPVLSLTPDIPFEDTARLRSLQRSKTRNTLKSVLENARETGFFAADAQGNRLKMDYFVSKAPFAKNSYLRVPIDEFRYLYCCNSIEDIPRNGEMSVRPVADGLFLGSYNRIIARGRLSRFMIYGLWGILVLSVVLFLWKQREKASENG